MNGILNLECFSHYFIAMKSILVILGFLCLLPYGSFVPIHHKLQTYRSIFKKFGAVESSVGCTVCKGLVEVLHGIGSTGIGEGELVELATKICLSAHIDKVSDRVCETVTKEFGNELWYVIIDAVVEPSKICGWIFGDKCIHFVDYFPPWNVTLSPRSFPIKDNWASQVYKLFVHNWKNKLIFSLDLNYIPLQ